jgi:glutathione S-transferase
MLLHDLAAGMNPRRVRIFLAEKGVTVPMRAVDGAAGETRSPAFLALNPLGTLPVLELDDGTVLAESIAICRWFESQHPDPPMFGRTPIEQARVEMWTRRMELELARPIVDTFVHSGAYFRDRVRQLPDYAEVSRERALEAMRWLDRELAGRPYVATADYTVADIVAQCALVLGKATGLRVPAECTELTRWFASVAARPTARA